jgi:3-hydroxy-9,10-secoandrosta-1,3,5(10)-triene-9,17-dione monooxygenase
VVDGADALRRARELAPPIAARAERTEQDRCIPDATIAEPHQSGPFGLVAPRRLGGADLGFADLLTVSAEVAAACGSTGWLYGVLAGHNWLLSLMPIEVQEEVFADPTALVASVFRFGATATEVDGGYRLTGESRFCSGVDHAR